MAFSVKIILVLHETGKLKKKMFAPNTCEVDCRLMKFA